MNKVEIENRLQELKEKNCKNIWIILKSSKVLGAELTELQTDYIAEVIELKIQKMALNFSEIVEIKGIY